MDFQALAQLLGNLGEFVGSIAVVATLMYLAVQLRQNTKALRIASLDSYATIVDSVMASHTECPEVFVKATSGIELSPEENVAFGSYAIRTFNNMEQTYLRYRAGFLDQDVYDARVRGFSYLMNESMQSAEIRRQWKAVNRFAFTDEFVGLMNEKIIYDPAQR